MSAEKYLIKYLLDNYEHVGVVGRPVFNTSETINVSYGIGLIQVLNLDEKNQILTTNIWCRYVSTNTLYFHALKHRLRPIAWRDRHLCCATGSVTTGN